MDDLVIRVRGLVALPAEDIALLLNAGNHAVAPQWQARLRWTLEPLRAATGVELRIEMRRRDWPLRAFVRLGGRRRLLRELERTLDALTEVAALSVSRCRSASPAFPGRHDRQARG